MERTFESARPTAGPLRHGPGPADHVDDVALAERIAQEVCGRRARVELIPSHYNAVFRLWFRDGTSKVLKLAKRPPDQASTRKELFIFERLVEHAVPAPVVEHQDVAGRQFGFPFFIMRSAGDRTVAEWVHEADDAAQRLLEQMGRVFALIHGVTFDKTGPIVHDRVSPVRNAALERRTFEEWCHRLIDDIERRGLLSAAEVKQVRKVVGGLPTMQGASLCHGDFHAAQCIVDVQAGVPRITAVVDWEAASAGDAVYDYADHHVYMDNTYHPVLVDAFRRGYESMRPLPRAYDADYKGVRMIQQLVLVRTFHRRVEPDRVRRGIEQYRKLAVRRRGLLG